MKKYWAEFLGTYILVFVGAGAIIINSVTEGTVSHLGIGLSFGLVVMAMIYAIGDITDNMQLAHSASSQGIYAAEHSCGVSNNKNESVIKKILINGSKQKKSLELDSLPNLIWFIPEMERLFSGSPSLRRNFIDRIVYSFDKKILFELNSNETQEQKYNLIIANIEESGFKNASNFYSISESSKFGGEIGWINKTQLSKSIIKEIEKIKVSKLTRAIQVGNNFMILKINDKRKINKKINFDEELKKLSFDSLPSETNFIFIECEGATNMAEKINSLLSENGIIVRQLHSYELPNCLRITIGTKTEMEKMIEVLRKGNLSS